MNKLPINEIKDLVKELKGRNGHEKIFKLLGYSLYFVILYLTVIISFFKTDFFKTALPTLVINSFREVGVSSEFAENLIAFLVIALLVLISVFLLLFRDLFCKNKGYSWKPSDGLKDWYFQGSIVVDEDNGEKVIKIKSSQLGAIIKNRSWRNYILTFEFKIPSKISYGQAPNEHQLERGFGIIYRAKNLGQYYMLKIDKSGYRPHINNNQYWEDLGPTVTACKPTKQWLDRWIPVKMIMKNNVLSVNIGDDEFQLHLQSYSLVYRESFPEKYEEKVSYEPSPFVPLGYQESGTVGFRSAPLEEVYIKNLKVTSEFVISQVLADLRNILTC